ncbi:MAG: hypothetical protein CMF31_08570 [Kordiimonas sp.]|nr:hypothetical protein [Kordiimonas sp.]
MSVMTMARITVIIDMVVPIDIIMLFIVFFMVLLIMSIVFPVIVNTVAVVIAFSTASRCGGGAISEGERTG